MSVTASTTTHFAQFLKVKSDSTCTNIVEKRKRNILAEFEQQIQLFKNNGLLSQDTPTVECFNLDYVDCLKNVPLSKDTLVYADPPYFKEHYSRYYHILNTVCRYDYPKMAINLQTKEYTIGRYREDRNISDFGKKSQALSAFQRLVDICANAGTWLMISYSDNSIVKIDEVLQLAKERFYVDIQKVELNHSKQGRSSISKVDEYLFICRPKGLNDNDIEEKISKIKIVKPVVDNPAGLMHNYMARKPYNIVAELISNFSPLGGLIYDPMFGSGTTMIEASKSGRNAVGTDINPLAYRLCYTSLKKWDLDKLAIVIEKFTSDVIQICAPIYSVRSNKEEQVIERCHFDQTEGRLVPTKYWYKTIINGKMSGRKCVNASEEFIKEYDAFADYSIKNIDNVPLIHNSRIAIGKEDTVHMYFCNRNLRALDLIMDILHKYKGSYGYEVLELIVSSSVNLIKLSDKKASSQMPYWLPKKNVTSRNAIMTIQKKAQSCIDGLKYLHDTCQTPLREDCVVGQNSILLRNMPAQSISKDDLPDESVDLIITDPPYTDQVPYLEYSQLWNRILGWDSNMDDELKAELVVSDAPSRAKDISDFNEIFEQILQRARAALKKQGYFIMFYHTFDLKSWSQILEKMDRMGFVYCSQIAVAAPRKSFKTVMSPKSTLDGNYVILFQKDTHSRKAMFKGTIEDAKAMAVQCAKNIIESKKDVTSQDLYDCGMLRDAIEVGYLSVLAQSYSSFIDVVSQDFEYVNGFWRERGCIGF